MTAILELGIDKDLSSERIGGSCARHRLPETPGGTKTPPGLRAAINRPNRALGGHDPARVRRPDRDDDPGRHPARPGRPARRGDRDRSYRPRSRSKYARSLPDCGMALVDPETGTDPFAQFRAHQFRAPTRLHAYPFGKMVVRVGRIASVVHTGSCWNAFTWPRNESCQQTW